MDSGGGDGAHEFAVVGVECNDGLVWEGVGVVEERGDRGGGWVIGSDVDHLVVVCVEG